MKKWLTALADVVSSAPALGATYTKTKTSFRVWAPDQQRMKVCLYKEARDPRGRLYPMKKEGEYFSCEILGDLDGLYYTYFGDVFEVTDPYSVACSINAKRSAIIDLRSTDPPGFEQDSFEPVPCEQAIIYEVHIGDFSFHPSSGVKDRGKFLAFTEEGTVCLGEKTGIDHLKELGITHVHLMPVAENATVDETSSRFGSEDNYNWGYDPELYNVPEGSYSTRPEDPKNRIREFKELILSLHQAGIGVVLDVVYNHTYKTVDSNFNFLAPGLYYRKNGSAFSNGSGVGNEVASEHPVVRQFILDSLLYWQREYHVDGFRFDLMALMDRETVREAVHHLRKEKPHVLIYGEPWTGGPSALAPHLQTLWTTQNALGFGLFNARYRDALRGDNNGEGRGFVQGNTDCRMDVETGLLGSIEYFQMRNGGARDPVDTINYFNAHDNLILEDKLTRSMGTEADHDAMTRLAFGLLLTSQGIPFFHAGNEFRRDKKGDANSYCSGYAINGMDWRLKHEHRDLFRYVKDLIAFRRSTDVFSLRSREEVLERVKLLSPPDPHLVACAYQLDVSDPNRYYVCFYYNGLVEQKVDGTFLFEAFDAQELEAQRVFDWRGALAHNKTKVLKEERFQYPVQPLSMVILDINVLR